MRFRVEPSPAGGYVVRLEGHDVPVSRHDTEEEAEEWVARHAGAAPAPARTRARRPHFVGLDDGTQVLVRPPRSEDGAAREAALVAVHPATGAVIGTVAPGEAPWVAPAWAGRGLEGHLRSESDSLRALDRIGRRRPYPGSRDQ